MSVAFHQSSCEPTPSVSDDVCRSEELCENAASNDDAFKRLRITLLRSELDAIATNIDAHLGTCWSPGQSNGLITMSFDPLLLLGGCYP